MEKKVISDKGADALPTFELKSVPQTRRRTPATGTKLLQFPYPVGSRLAHSGSRNRISEGAINLALRESEEYFLQLFREAHLFMKHRGGQMVMEKDVLAALAARENTK
jgi:histone H3/H4